MLGRVGAEGRLSGWVTVSVYLPSVCYDDVIERCVTLAEAGEADLDDHVGE